jgi:hypothetical protein
MFGCHCVVLGQVGTSQHCWCTILHAIRFSFSVFSACLVDILCLFCLINILCLFCLIDILCLSGCHCVCLIVIVCAFYCHLVAFLINVWLSLCCVGSSWHVPTLLVYHLTSDSFLHLCGRLLLINCWLIFM